MKENPVRSIGISRSQLSLGAFVFLGCVAILPGGCAERRRPSIPWSTAIQVRPAKPPQTVTAADVSEDPVPDLRLELPAFPFPVAPVKSPARPHVAASTAGAGIEPEKKDSPLLAPQLSPQESVAAQQQANESLSIAEKNLAAMRGKKLNAAQADMLSKIQGFLKDAREAAGIQDWSRARSLSKKAQLLSEELVNSN